MKQGQKISFFVCL